MKALCPLFKEAEKGFYGRIFQFLKLYKLQHPFQGLLIVRDHGVRESVAEFSIRFELSFVEKLVRCRLMRIGPVGALVCVKIIRKAGHEFRFYIVNGPRLRNPSARRSLCNLRACLSLCNDRVHKDIR